MYPFHCLTLVREGNEDLKEPSVYSKRRCALDLELVTSFYETSLNDGDKEINYLVVYCGGEEYSILEDFNVFFNLILSINETETRFNYNQN